jgi:hypothetical protein
MVGDVRQNLQAVTTRRRNGRVGLGRSHEINRRVLGQLVFLEHRGEVLALVAAEEEVVMRELRVLAIQAEVQHKAGASGFEFSLQRCDKSLALAQQLVVGGNDFHVRHDDVGGVKSSVRHEARNATEARVLAGTRSGGACVNDAVSHMIGAGLPFGGLGESGLGAYHGRAGFEAFSHQRAVLRRATWLDTPFRYPPQKLSLAALKRAMRFLLRD